MNRKTRNSFKLLIPLIALFLCGIVVLVERSGVQKQQMQQNLAKELTFTDAIQQQKSCLLLTIEEDEVSQIYQDMMGIVLENMKIGYDVTDVTDGITEELLSPYQTVIITFQDWSVLGSNLQPLFAWVGHGGELMTTVSPIYSGSFQAIMQKVGIIAMEEEYPEVFGFRMLQDCMIGATEEDIFQYAVDGEGLRTSLYVELNEDCDVWMESADGKVPLLWTKDYGEGRIAIVNISIADKYQRGFLTLAYSLLREATIYPVINASAYYLDDFPAPVPGGDGSYIRKEYGVDTATFYANIWWPTVLEWEKKYGIYHTGLIIELYSDEVKAPFETNTAISQFLTYGNMLLNNGGELGIHGYNHMPLCLKGEDEELQYGEYELWNSMEDMKASLTEVKNFSTRLFNDNMFQVYVPPSNILSDNGRAAILEACPDIWIIASTYLKDAHGIAREQEFEVGEDGIVDTPRITSGCLIDDYQKIVALSELNFHFVQSHFIHPDDVLDEDRGAAEGWKKMSEAFEEYLDWISTSAPMIRNVTGSGMGVAVRQYDELSIQRETKEDKIIVSLGGFSGKASFLMRLMEGEIAETEGCTCEKVTGDLYLVQATEDTFVISWK